MRILYAEDEADLNRLITDKLVQEGYSVDSCLDGADAIDHFDAAEYDGVVLDVMMPGADGYQVLEHIKRQTPHVPVLFLTARDSVEDRVRGLDAGADDYLVKPFSVEELAARVRAMLRKNFVQTDAVMRVADLEMDTIAHTVSRGGENIRLTAKEYQLLEYLMRNEGIVLSREKIEDHIWNFNYEGGSNTVDVYIRYLRKKIDDDHDQKLIQTVRGAGYVLKAE